MDRSRHPPATSRDPAPTAPRSRRRSRQLALAEVPPGEPSLEPSIPLRQLWLGIHLPALPLEAVFDGAGPAAVFEESRGIRKVLLADAMARAAGVASGLTLNGALALLPALHVAERDPEREAAVLRELAAWSETFTSFVSIEPPNLLLLEIAGSLNLFGGLRALRQRVMDGLGRQGFAADASIAPTPLAATWLARAGRKASIRDPRNLAGRLAPLPLACLGWPDDLQRSLDGMGVATVGEALRLPRQGVAKRFGASRLLEFDRALGRLPDPRVCHRTPECFIADFDLNEEQSDNGLILAACRTLLARLERFLLRRQTAVQQVQFSFFHLREPATGLELGCVQPTRSVAHWCDLLAIRFERLELPAPAIAIRLAGGQAQSFEVGSEALPFRQGEPGRPQPAIATLAERLCARIGDGSVHGVATVAEHRPQHAWQARAHDVACPAGGPAARANPEPPAGMHRAGSLVQRRPLWLLDTPQPLEVRQQRPRYGGPLELLDGPERIETGWWDEDGIARDYYVAVNPQRIHLWIYRDRGRDRRWFLHGMFG